MFRFTACLTIATLVNLGFSTDKALAQLSSGQCRNIHNQIYNAYFGKGFPSNPNTAQRLYDEMMSTTLQFYEEYPECEENVNYRNSTRNNETRQQTNNRDRRNLEDMREYSNQQIENFTNLMDLME